MRFKLDENLPLEIIQDLRGAGHDIDSVYDEGLAGAVDEAIVAIAIREKRILLTMDKGLGDLRLKIEDCALTSGSQDHRASSGPWSFERLAGTPARRGEN